MKNRFVEIYESKPNQYINGAPLVINAGKLLFDNNSRKYVIQVKFQSITEKPISSVEICIEISNVQNEKKLQNINIWDYIQLAVNVLVQKKPL